MVLGVLTIIQRRLSLCRTNSNQSDGLTTSHSGLPAYFETRKPETTAVGDHLRFTQCCRTTDGLIFTFRPASVLFLEWPAVIVVVRPVSVSNSVRYNEKKVKPLSILWI